jgi:hypothetical protein
MVLQYATLGTENFDSLLGVSLSQLVRALVVVVAAVAVVTGCRPSVPAPPSPLRGPDCTYEQCALGLGPGEDTSHALEGAGGEITQLYRSSHRHYNRWAFFSAPYLIGAIGTLTYYSAGRSERGEWKGFPAPGIVLPLTALGFGWASNASAVRAEEQLSRAVWLYNRSLPHIDPPVYNCAYDRCAVRLEHRFWSTRLVQGSDSRWIGTVSSGSRIGIFDSSPDERVRSSYESFLVHRRTARSIRLLSLGLYLGAGTLFASSDGKGAQILGTGMLVLGNWVGHSAMYAQGEASAALDLAIWHYNRGLKD